MPWFPDDVMTIDPMRRAYAYRLRSIDLLAIAETMQESTMKAMLLQTAQDYQRMAVTVERLAKREQRLRETVAVASEGTSCGVPGGRGSPETP